MLAALFPLMKVFPPKLFFCHSSAFAPRKEQLMEEMSLFDIAVEDSKTLKERPSNEILLQLYSLFKQGTVGDAKDSEGPKNPFDILAKAKYEAWLQLKGMSLAEAQLEYVNLVNRLKAN